MAMASSSSNIVKAPSFLCFKTAICFLTFISGETNVAKLLETQKTPAAQANPHTAAKIAFSTYTKLNINEKGIFTNATNLH